MTDQADDMVITVALDTTTSAQQVAKGERIAGIGRRLGGLVRGATLAKSVTGLAGDFPGMGGVGAISRFSGATMIAAQASLLAGLAYIRLASGRSFANLGANINNALLGVMDDKARAKRRVRQELQANPQLMGMVARHPEMMAEAAEVGEMTYKQYLTEEIGRSKIAEDIRFQSDDSLPDLIIKRLRDGFTEYLGRSEGWQAVQALPDEMRKGGK